MTNRRTDLPRHGPFISAKNKGESAGAGSVSVLGGVIFRGDHQTSAFSCTPIHGLHNINHLLLVLQSPVDLVIVTGAKINHDVLVPEEEHAGARVIQLVHLVEVWHLCDVDQVDDSKVLDLFSNVIQNLIHLHAGWVPVVAEADYL